MIGGTDGTERLWTTRLRYHLGTADLTGRSMLYNGIPLTSMLLFYQVSLPGCDSRDCLGHSPVFKEVVREDDQDQRPDLLNAANCRTTHRFSAARRPVSGRYGSSKSEHHVWFLVVGGFIRVGRRRSNIVGRLAGLSAPKSATKMADLTPHWARLSRCSGEGVKQLLSACAGRSGLPRQLRVTVHT